MILRPKKPARAQCLACSVQFARLTLGELVICTTRSAERAAALYHEGRKSFTDPAFQRALAEREALDALLQLHARANGCCSYGCLALVQAETMECAS